MAEEEEALFQAARAGDGEYLDQNRDPRILSKLNPQGDTACHVALREGRHDFVSLMASIHPPILCQPDADGDTVLHCLLKMGVLNLLYHCLSQLRMRFREHIGKDFRPDNGSSDHIPVEVLNCVRALRNAEGKSLVYMAAENGYDEAVRRLMLLPLLRRADGPNRSTALHVAVRKGYRYIAKVLLGSIMTYIILHQDGDGNTALHLAVMQIDISLVKELLRESYAQQLVKILNNDGHSPVHLAATMNYELFRLLLQLCPECYLTNTARNQNLLHLAVREKDAEIVKVIVNDKKMAEYMINQQDSEGNTPLHIAASDGNKEMLNTLLASRVPVQTLKNKEGLTFLNISKALEARKGRR